MGWIILQRNLARRTLLEKKNLLQTIIDAIPMPIYYKDLEGRYLGCNKKFSEFWKHPSPDIIGKTVVDIVPQEDVEKFVTSDEEFYASPKPQVYETQISDEGVLPDILVHKAPFNGIDGKVAGLVGALLDITEHNALLKAAKRTTNAS